MGLATIQFYKNPYDYPKYTETLTPVGSSFQATPLGVGLKSGSMFLSGTMSTFMSFNYMKIVRDGATIWAWVDDVDYEVDGGFTVKYSVDPWRTYKSKVTLGSQFVARQPQETIQKDGLLGADTTVPSIHTEYYQYPNASKRYFVIQINPSDNLSISNTPGQPTPYQIYAVEYDVTSPRSTQAINDLFVAFQNHGKPTNFVTMYSVPYINTTQLASGSLPFEKEGEDVFIPGWKYMTPLVTYENSLWREIAIDRSFFSSAFRRREHSVQLVIPEAGIMTLTDEMLAEANLYLRQDVDLFSGASNYLLHSGTNRFLSLRGSSLNSIPIVGDPYDTYLSQNQNTISATLLNDVANLGGIALGGLTGGFAGAAVGAFNTMLSINSRNAGIEDLRNKQSNPQAFLGSALTPLFNSTFWISVSQQTVDNGALVNQNYGYPINKIKPLAFPSSGYIKTESCSVAGDGTVPRWALREINTMFDSGILVL